MFIDRAGAKIGLIEQLSRNSKASLSFVAEQVSLPPLAVSGLCLTCPQLLHSLCAAITASPAGSDWI